MPDAKVRLPGRFVGGVRVSSGSAANLMKEIWAGSVAANSPSFGGGSLVGSREGLSVTVTGLNASMIILVNPASMPGGCVLFNSACAITDAIETTWIHTASAAAAGCAITLNYIAIQT